MIYINIEKIVHLVMVQNNKPTEDESKNTSQTCIKWVELQDLDS